MSFLWLADKPLKSREEIAREVHSVSVARGLDELATVMALMTISTEVGANDRNGNRQWWCPWNAKDPSSENYPHDSQSDDGRSVGYYQQQNGIAGESPLGRDNWWGSMKSRMTLAQSTDVFLERLSDDYVSAAGNPIRAGEFAQAVQGSAFPDRYAEKWEEAWGVLRSALQTPSGVPNFIENNVINNWRGRPYGNYQSRNGQKVRFLVLHTSEGAGGAGLLDYMQGASVSYHDVIDDTGANKATIWHLVDKNRAAWSVGNGNNYTINYCFGTSFAKRHSRADWLRLQDDSIKALAWQVAQDCKRFNIPPVIMVGGSASGYPALKKPGAMGITDHRGMTTIAGGNHTDVGDQFPWDVFGQYLRKYYDNEQDDMFTDEDRELLKRVHFELTHPWNSASMYAAPDEVADPKSTLVGVTLAIDGMTHALVVEDRARKGDEDSIMRLIRTAAGEGKYGKDPRVMSRAEAALDEVPEDILDAYLARQ